MEKEDLCQPCQGSGLPPSQPIRNKRSTHEEVAANKLAKLQKKRERVQVHISNPAIKFGAATPDSLPDDGAVSQASSVSAQGARNVPPALFVGGAVPAHLQDEAMQDVGLHNPEESDLECKRLGMHQCFGQQGLPLTVRRHAEAHLMAVKFAVPGMQVKSAAPPAHPNGKKVTLDLNHFNMPGVGIARGETEENEFVWYCDCSAHNISIERSLESLHTYAGGCSILSDADCVHVKYCKYALSKTIMDIAAFIEDSSTVEDDNTGWSMPTIQFRSV